MSHNGSADFDFLLGSSTQWIEFDARSEVVPTLLGGAISNLLTRVLAQPMTFASNESQLRVLR